MLMIEKKSQELNSNLFCFFNPTSGQRHGLGSAETFFLYQNKIHVYLTPISMLGTRTKTRTLVIWASLFLLPVSSPTSGCHVMLPPPAACDPDLTNRKKPLRSHNSAFQFTTWLRLRLVVKHAAPE